MKMQWRKVWLGCMGLALFEISVQAQTCDWVSSCEGKTWTRLFCMIFCIPFLYNSVTNVEKKL